MNTIAIPFGVLLMFLYELFNNYGLAIILFAIIVKVIMLPFQMKSKRSTMQTSRLQPKLKELEKKHGANKAKYNEEVAKLYKEEKVNPASGCLWSFLPLPVLFALYYAIRQPITIMMGVAADLLAEGGAIFLKLQELGFTTTVSKGYEQIAQTQFISDNFDKFAGLSDKLRQIDFGFLGMDLGAQPQWNFLWTTNWGDAKVWLPGLALFLIPILSGLSQFVATKISQKMNPVGSPEGQGGSMQTMMLIMPLFSIYIAFIMPAALGLYWTIGTLLQIGQDIWLTKRYTKRLDAEDAVKNEQRKIKEAELEAKRLETERKKAEGVVAINPNTSKRKKQTTEKQEQIGKAAEWQKRNAPPTEEEPSRVGNRRYARGRAYEAERYAADGGAETDEPEQRAALDESAIAKSANEAEPVDALVDEEAAGSEDIINEDSADFTARFETTRFDGGPSEENEDGAEDVKSE